MDTTRQDCIDLVEELNYELNDITYFENYFNIRFKYVTEGNYDYILLGDIVLYSSDDGRMYKRVNHEPVEITLREHLLTELQKMLFHARKTSFWIQKELKSYVVQEDNST
jgi:hypothetical protein